MKYKLFLFYFTSVHVILIYLLTTSNLFFTLKNHFGLISTQNELTPHYYKMTAFHQRIDLNALPKSVIFFGDSHIQGLAVSSISENALNYGIGYDTTEGLLKRLPIYSSLKHAKMIIIEIGYNDLKRRSDQQIKENFLKIINALPKNIPILFNALLPVDEITVKRHGYNDRIRKINSFLLSLTESNTNIILLNMNQLITDDKGNLSDQYHIGDGIHLNASGNEVWISKIKLIINKYEL